MAYSDETDTEPSDAVLAGKQFLRIVYVCVVCAAVFSASMFLTYYVALLCFGDEFRKGGFTLYVATSVGVPMALWLAVCTAFKVILNLPYGELADNYLANRTLIASGVGVLAAIVVCLCCSAIYGLINWFR